MNTLRYLFEHMRCGIFVKIRAGQLVMFVPFANDAYTNTWAGEMEVGACCCGWYGGLNMPPSPSPPW